ncbi:hypothetical protein GCM10027029_18690 [Conyzicola lurida]
MIRVTNYGTTTYRGIRLSRKRDTIGISPWSAENIASVSIPDLKPGHSHAFDRSALGLTEAVLDSPAPYIGGIDAYAFHVRLDFSFANPSALRRQFKRTYDWWDYIEPINIVGDRPLQHAVEQLVESAYRYTSYTVPARLRAKVLAMSDSDATKAINAPRDRGATLSFLDEFIKWDASEEET